MFSIDKLSQSYQPEQVLLILITRLYFKTETRVQVQAYIDAQDICWDKFYQLTSMHRMRSFVYDTIVMEQIIIHPKTKELLLLSATSTTMKGLHQLKYLRTLLSELKNEGFRVIPYKGVLFGMRFYRSAALRESSDIDFFVDKKDAATIMAWLSANGYQITNAINDRYWSYLITFFKEMSFKTPADESGMACNIEIKWRLIDRYIGRFPGFNFFSAHLTKFLARETDIQVLDATHEMLCLVSHHFIKEPLAQFKYLVDVACILVTAGAELDRAKIKRTIKKYHYDVFFAAAMQTVSDLIGIDISAWNLQPVENEILCRQCIAVSAVGRSLPNDNYSRSVFIALQKNRLERLKLRLRIIAYTFLPTKNDLAIYRIPIFLFPVYLLIRPFRLFFKYVVLEKNVK